MGTSCARTGGSSGCTSSWLPCVRRESRTPVGFAAAASSVSWWASRRGSERLQHFLPRFGPCKGVICGSQRCSPEPWRFIASWLQVTSGVAIETRSSQHQGFCSGADPVPRHFDRRTRAQGWGCHTGCADPTGVPPSERGCLGANDRGSSCCGFDRLRRDAERHD